MSELEALQAGDAKLETQEQTLSAELSAIKGNENALMAQMRVIGKKLRQVRSARAELQRRIKAEENPLPPITPEVETIIQSVTATAQAATGPPKTEA
jgi:chromosome segregation ATPase